MPYVYAGVQLIAPALLAGTPEGPFSMNLAWDSAMAAGRLRAVVHDGLWFHLSTPADLAEAESTCACAIDQGDPLNLFTILPALPFLDALATEWLASAAAIRWRSRAG